MGPQPLQLSMGPLVHFCSSVCQLFAQLGVLDMTVLVVRGMTAAAGSWVYDGTWCEVQQAFVFPDPGPVIPIIFARLRTVGHDEGGGVGGFACVPELKHVFIYIGNGNVVFDSGMPVQDHAHVVVKGGSAFGYYAHFQLPCRGDHLLPLVPPGLVIAFYG